MSVAGPIALNQERFGPRFLRLPALAGLAIVLVALLGLLYLTQTSGVAITGYDVQALEAERAQWQLRNDQLRSEILAARSLDRVEREASARLGMRQPERVVFVQAPAPRPTPSDPDAGTPRAILAARSGLDATVGWLRSGR